MEVLRDLGNWMVPGSGFVAVIRKRILDSKELHKKDKNMSCLTASIIGLSSQCVEEICRECSKYGIVQITNYCCSGNVSIGGEKSTN